MFIYLQTEIKYIQIILFSQEQDRKMPLFYCHSHISPTGDRRCPATPNRQFVHQLSHPDLAYEQSGHTLHYQALQNHL